MKKQNEIAETTEIHDFQKGFLTLPFNGDQFAVFIKGLLGTPQTITKRIRGNFEIHPKDLQNFHDLIDQRISQQNNGKLIQLKTQIYYTDESSVTLSSYEELVTYNEVKPVISEAVRMTWSYLIQFADKEAPEKQEIELLIVSTIQENVIEDDIPVVYPTLGQFKIIIKHTARSFGSDIESLLTHQINSLIIPCSELKTFLRKKSSTIGILTAILFLISSLTTIYISTQSFNKNEINRVANFIKDSKYVSAKTDYILNYIATNSQNLFFLKSLLFVVVSIFISIILGVWVESLADNKVKSYLIMTREALKNRDRLVKKSQRKFVLFWVSIGISVATGILANYIFKLLNGI